MQWLPFVPDLVSAAWVPGTDGYGGESLRPGCGYTLVIVRNIQRTVDMVDEEGEWLGPLVGAGFERYGCVLDSCGDEAWRN